MAEQLKAGPTIVEKQTVSYISSLGAPGRQGPADIAISSHKWLYIAIIWLFMFML